MKICFLAPSSYGKSTAIDILKKYYDIENVKIAEPLYELQNSFYKKIGINIENKQDGELLQFYGKKIRKENSNFLLNEFQNKVNDLNSNIISNDDCRPDDYSCLKEMGFIFIKINSYRRDRDDITLADSKASIEWQEEILFDYQINNYGSLEEYENELLNLMDNILNCSSNKIKLKKKVNI